MADAEGSSAPPEEIKTYLDEVTGEQVSKSELKKRQKLRQKEEEKARKAAAAPPKPVVVKKPNAEAEEKELNANVCYSVFSQLNTLANNGGVAIFRNSIPCHQQASNE
jgi:lysyl-tRNA synthetase class 2